MVVTARDAGQLGRSDAEQLTFAAASERVLLTHDRVHFERLHREWLDAGRNHAGILVGRRRMPAELATRIGRLLLRLSAQDLQNQFLYI